MKLYQGSGRADLVCPAAKLESGHLAVHFVWPDGGEHADHHAAELTCHCGRRLVHSAGTDPWSHPWAEVEGEPHGA